MALPPCPYFILFIKKRKALFEKPATCETREIPEKKSKKKELNGVFTGQPCKEVPRAGVLLRVEICGIVCRQK